MEIVRDVNQVYVDTRSFGQLAADSIAKVVGSWSFIILFLLSLLLWVILNTKVIGPKYEAFDPYLYVFLNLMPSMLAAVQAPIIMMSQNRPSAHDGLDVETDHEVNVHAEYAIQNVDKCIQMLEHQVKEVNHLLLAHNQAID